MAVPLFNAVWLIFLVGQTMCRVCSSRLTSSQQILHRHVSFLVMFFGGGQFGESEFLLMSSLCIVMITSVSPSRYFLDLKSTCPCLSFLAALTAVVFALCSHVVGVLSLPHVQVALSGLL